MTLEETLAQLESLGNEKVRVHNSKNGADVNQFGVRMKWRGAGPACYTLLTLLPGDDFVNVYQETTAAQQKQLGKDVAGFLDKLQEISGTHYDIGLYVPALPPTIYVENIFSFFRVSVTIKIRLVYII